MLLWQSLVLYAHLITLPLAQNVSPRTWVWVRTDSRNICEDGKCYFISDKKATWQSALMKCQEHGLCLACLECSGSLNQMSKHFQNRRIRDELWVGLTSYSQKSFVSVCTNKTTTNQISPSANKINPKKPFGTVKFNNNKLIIGSASSKREKRFLCAQEDECFGHFTNIKSDKKPEKGKDNSNNNKNKVNDKNKNKTNNDLNMPIVIKCDCNNGTDYNINSRSGWTVPKGPALKYVLGAKSLQPYSSLERSKSRTYVVNCVCTKNNNNVNVHLNEIKKKGQPTQTDVAKIISELAGIMKRTDVKKYSCEAS